MFLSQESAATKTNGATRITHVHVPEGATHHDTIMRPNWEGMEDVAAVRMFIRRAVKEGLEAIVVKEHLEGAANKFIVQGVKEGLEGAVVRDFIARAVREELQSAAMKQSISQSVKEVLESAAMKHSIHQVVTESMAKDVHVSLPASSDMSAVDREKEMKMKHEKDVLGEHATLSRVLFGVALAFTLPYIIARSV